MALLLQHVLSLTLYGDSMILAECIFSQSATRTGEVSGAYFRKLAISGFWGCGVLINHFRQIFANGPNQRAVARPYGYAVTHLTVQPDMRPASTSKKPTIREVAGRRAVQKPGSLWL